ncbi:MAG: gliding motility-associated C-terminal domain-containing protein [Prevotella sp.]|nr:gliding motility-associated C-terminal domain-containing protein [Prevotella sp.]
MKFILREMQAKHIIAMIAMAMLPLRALADFSPTAYYTVDGEELEATDAINDAQAPLTVTFMANPTNIAEGIAPSYEWRFVRDGSTEAYITRYEENTTFEFRESGVTNVSLYVSYGDGNDPELISTIRVGISTSLLEMPNAFSPNGDGINDIYRAKTNHKSIVEFKAYIFNRWGQKIYEWTDINGGWDGTKGGSPVKPGVYFVLVKAKGADGKEYNIKRDVNLLRDYIEGNIE